MRMYSDNDLVQSDFNNLYMPDLWECSAKEKDEMEERLEALKDDLIVILKKISNDDKVVINAKKKSLFLQNRSERGSRFRGVSKNGRKWQVMIVKGQIKKYVGTISLEYQAARIYDKYSTII